MNLSARDLTNVAGQAAGEGRKTGGAAGVIGAVSAEDALKLARRGGFKLEIDGDFLAYEVPDDPIAHSIIDILRQHKPEIVDLMRDERRAVVRWIAENFRSAPIGQCAQCGGGKREDDPFVLVFVGEDRADLHAACYPIWRMNKEAEARVALEAQASSIPSFM